MPPDPNCPQEHPRPAAAEARSRTLLYFPIVHTQADMGRLSASIRRATLGQVGQRGLYRKTQAIDRVWTEIEAALGRIDLPYARVRLYQDGLPVCGREAAIVLELARTGSRNHQLLERLLAKGAVLMGTESWDLLLQEYDLAKQALAPGGSLRPAPGRLRRPAGKDALLDQRDRFIAQRINTTLQQGETGILFLGMLHSLEGHLDRDIQIIYLPRRPVKFHEEKL